ncbi:MAG TPA: hypothetical protein VEL07_17990 [Planctomycetota bacterium]|nr:hypothetical protein [Planctomycetota bacterium]
MHPACHSLREHGFAVLVSEFDAGELALIRAIVADAWRRAGSPPRGGEFGFVMHPLIAYAPEMARFYERPRVIAVLRDLFGEEPRLVHNGGLWSDGSRSFTRWHHHRDDSGDDRDGEAAGSGGLQARIDRVLANVYVDGATPELGELLVWPRRVDDPLAGPGFPSDREWAGQEVVRCPPGSVVIFDQSLHHAARPARVDASRLIFGGHYQPWSRQAAHREDNAADLPEIREEIDRSAILRALVRAR